MKVIKRSGRVEEVSFDKIIKRLRSLCEVDPKLNIDATDIAQQVISEICDGIKTTELDEEAAKKCAYMVTIDPAYGELASRIIISNNQKNTSNSFSETVTQLYNNTDIHGKQVPLVSDGLYKIVMEHKHKLNDVIDYSRDFGFDYFAYKTLERAYLIKMNGKNVERIQHMIMRVSIGLHEKKILSGERSIKIALETYELISQKCFTHATPTLFHAGTPFPQLLSCFLLGIEDSIQGIYKCLSDCAMISKWAGGIGVHINNIRAEGSSIRGTNGRSNGIVPMLKVFNETARYVDQCVMPETIIYTTEGPMEIQHCEAGKTQIFTTNGPETIENVLEHAYEGRMLKINTAHSHTPLMITPEHPVYCLRNQKKGINYQMIRNRLQKGLAKPEWIDAKELTQDDMFIYTTPNYEQDNNKITEEDCYMYGLLLGDGCMNNKSTTCYISLNSTDKRDVIDFVKTYLTQRCILFFETEENNTTRIRWNKNTILPFRYTYLYNNLKQKYIHPTWLNLPLNKTNQIIRGLIHTDGCIRNEITFDSTSAPLINGLKYLLLRNGIPTGGYIRDRVGESHVTKYGDTITNQQISYCVRIPRTDTIAELLSIDAGKFHKFFSHENMIFSRISDITYSNYEGTLYDLQMTKTHDYMIENGTVHNGGGKRKGSIAIYLAPWHADIEDFLNLKKNHGKEEMIARDLFYALWIPDLFMKRVKAGAQWSLFCPDECQGLADTYGEEFETLYAKYEAEGKARRQIPARDLFNKIVISQIETGVPYTLFSDAANIKSNQKNLGMIKSSNLCVAPETLILTDQGHKQICTLENKEVNVWNGKEFSKTTIRKTGKNQELIKVTFSDETSIECTKYHKFYIQKKYINTKELKKDVLNSSSVTIMEAQELKENMKLVKSEYPIIDNNNTMKYPYTHGFFCGDGTYAKCKQENKKCQFKAQEGKAYCKRHIDQCIDNSVSEYCQGISYSDRPVVSLYGDKMKLIDYLEYRSKGSIINNRQTIILPFDLDNKYKVPINYSLETKMEWFAGYCDADGCICINEGNQSLQICSIEKDFLLNIKLMLQTCGVFTTISTTKKSQYSELPDGKGGKKMYKTKPQWRLFVASNELQKLVNIGFTPKRLQIKEHRPNRTAYRFVTVKNIEYTNRMSDTYCFNEPKRHAGIFNGIITGNCSEILEYSDTKEYACCTLASICLPQCVTEKDFSNIEEVTIYTKDKCNYCKLAKMLCKQYNLNVNEINLTDKPEELTEAKEEISSKYGGEFKTFPQIIVEFKDSNATLQYVGGYSDFEEFTRPYYDFEKLAHITKVVTNNLNEVIDMNRYPVPETERSNKRHRPLGIGVQGLADTYAKMRYGFDSPEAMQLNKDMFAVMYYAAMQKSLEIAKTDGAYETFKGSPLSEGKFQFDLWNVEPVRTVGRNDETYHKYNNEMQLDWDSLRTEVMEHGVRNSLLMALMPTASTSQIMGNNECIEPFTSNIYLRRVLAGEFIVVNKYLLQDLKNLGLWNKDMKTTIIYYKGSIQEIDEIPSTIRNLYKTTWDLKQKVIVDQAADRGPYVCQTQSMNIHMPQPTRRDIQNLHFYSWKRGLKTGLYYLRTKGGKDAQQVTIDPKFQEKLKKKKEMQEHERKMSNTSLLEGEENRALAEHISSFEGNKQEVCENCSA